MVLINQQNFTTNPMTELLTYNKWPTEKVLVDQGIAI